LSERKEYWHKHYVGGKSITDEPRVKAWLESKGVTEEEFKAHKKISLLLREWMTLEAYSGSGCS